MGTLWCKETEKSCITPMKSQRREIPKFASEKNEIERMEQDRNLYVFDTFSQRNCRHFFYRRNRVKT